MEESKTELPPELQKSMDSFNTSAVELKKKMADLEASSQILLLSSEEQDVLKHFRLFKSKLTKVTNFTWQTVPYTEAEKESMVK